MIGTPFHLIFGCFILLSRTRPLPSKKIFATTYFSLGLKNLSNAASSIQTKAGATFPCLYLQSNLPRVYWYSAQSKTLASLLKNSVFPELAAPCIQTALVFYSLLRMSISHICLINVSCPDTCIILLISLIDLVSIGMLLINVVNCSSLSGRIYWHSINSSKNSDVFSN